MGGGEGYLLGVLVLVLCVWDEDTSFCALLGEGDTYVLLLFPLVNLSAFSV